jgi:LysM repeat protein
VKFKVLFILTGVIVSHAVILTGVALTGGCKSPAVLGPRPFIAAPPPQDEIEDEQITDDIITDSGPKVTITTQQITPRPMGAPPVFILGPPPEGIFYTVKKNDSFWKISKSHGVTMQSLAAYNDMSLNKVLRVGEKLRIPPGGYAVKIKAPVKTVKRVRIKPQARPSDGVYIVKRRDSFWKIAKKYNLKTRTLLDANNMTGRETLQVGQKIIIPDGKNSVSATAPTEAPRVTDNSVRSILDSVETPDSNEAKDTPNAVKKLIEDEVIDDSGDSDRAVQVIKDINAEDFAKQYKISTAMLKKLNEDYPADGVFKAGSVVIVRSAE